MLFSLGQVLGFEVLPNLLLELEQSTEQTFIATLNGLGGALQMMRSQRRVDCPNAELCFSAAAHANKDQANVLVLNLRNRMIFRAADEECAKQSAAFIGKKLVNRRSRSVGSRGVTYSYQQTEDYKYHPFKLRELPLYRAVLVHAGRPGQFKKVSLKMLTGSEIKKHKEITYG